MKFASKLHPTRTFAYGMQEAVKKCMASLQTDSHYSIVSVDPEDGEIRCIWNLKLSKLLGDPGVLIRYSFIEKTPGVTVVTASVSRADGSGVDFLDIGGKYEKVMCMPFDKM